MSHHGLTALKPDHLGLHGCSVGPDFNREKEAQCDRFYSSWQTFPRSMRQKPDFTLKTSQRTGSSFYSCVRGEDKTESRYLAEVPWLTTDSTKAPGLCGTHVLLLALHTCITHRLHMAAAQIESNLRFLWKERAGPQAWCQLWAGLKPCGYCVREEWKHRALSWTQCKHWTTGSPL